MSDNGQAGELDLDAILSLRRVGLTRREYVDLLAAEVQRLRERVAELELGLECAEGDAREMGYLASDGGWES